MQHGRWHSRCGGPAWWHACVWGDHSLMDTWLELPWPDRPAPATPKADTAPSGGNLMLRCAVPTTLLVCLAAAAAAVAACCWCRRRVGVLSSSVPYSPPPQLCTPQQSSWKQTVMQPHVFGNLAPRAPPSPPRVVSRSQACHRQPARLAVWTALEGSPTAEQRCRVWRGRSLGRRGHWEAEWVCRLT